MGETHHLAITLACMTRGTDAANGPRAVVEMYVDGEKIGREEDFLACLRKPDHPLAYKEDYSPSRLAPWELGAEYDSGGELDSHQTNVKVKPSDFFHGIYDEFVVWNCTLTAAEVLQVAQGGLPHASRVAVRYTFDLDEVTECADRQLWDSNITCFRLNEVSGRTAPAWPFPWTNAPYPSVTYLPSPFHLVPGSPLHRTMESGDCVNITLRYSDPDGDEGTFSLSSLSGTDHSSVRQSGDQLEFCDNVGVPGYRQVEIAFDVCDPLQACASHASGLGKVIFHVLPAGPVIQAFQFLTDSGELRLVFSRPTNMPRVPVSQLFDFDTSIEVGDMKWEVGGQAVRLHLKAAPSPLPPVVTVQVLPGGGLRDAAETTYKSRGHSPNLQNLTCLDGHLLFPGAVDCKPCQAGFIPIVLAGLSRGPRVTRHLCQPCARGRVAIGVKCTKCGAGTRANDDQSECIICESGKFSPTGDSTCSACSFGTTSGPASAACSFDPLHPMLLCCFIVQFVAVYPLCWSIRRGIRVVDISQLGDKLVVKTLRAHGFYGRPTKVSIAGTGHQLLDKPASRFNARALGPGRIELIHLNGEPIMECIESSMGTLRQCFPNDLVNSGSFAPTLVLSLVLLPIPWIIMSFEHLYHTDEHAHVGRSLHSAGVALGTVVAAAVAALNRLRYFRSLTPMERRIDEFQTQLLEKNPNPTSCERGPGRAVTVYQLLQFQFFFRDIIQNRTAYYLEPNVIRPLTKPYWLSFAELVGPRQLTFFVSHFWGTAFSHFVESIQGHAENTSIEDWRSLAYWICFVSNNQWEITKELGSGDWRESSFYKALHSGFCHATCMVLDAEALPLKRSWCIFEVLQTYRLQHENVFDNFDGLCFCTNRGVIGDSSKDCYDIAVTLARKLATLRLQDATASSKDDERMINDLVEEEGGMTTMNQFIRDNMLFTLHSVHTHFNEEMDSLEQGLRKRTLNRLPSVESRLLGLGSHDFQSRTISLL